jgi:pimeloyl-ACP methyl ester carboxylesterase
MKRIAFISAFTFLLLFSYGTDNTKSKTENRVQAQAFKEDSPVKNGYSDVNGLKMYWEIHGNNHEFLVLIHGGGSTIGTTFGRILPPLAKYYSVIALELQAHGHTSDRNLPESFERDADDVAELLHNLQIPKASFFGFSNGGNTAMQIAVRHPELVNKLIIASSFYKREGMQPSFFEGLEKASIKDMPEALKAAFLQINPDSSKLFTMFNKDRERMLRFKDWDDGIVRSIKAPALIICGDHDVMIPEHAVAMSRLIMNSRLMILPATHGSYIGVAEGPGDVGKLTEMTIEVIADFLNGENLK